MKNYFKMLIAVVLVVFLASCSATNRLTIGATEPAAVQLPKETQRVGIVNRSLPSKGNKTLDKIDRVLSAEGIDLDKKGAEAAISALASELSVIKNLEKIEIIKDVEALKNGLAVLPSSMTWEMVERLCEAYQVDVIFSLAFYDTDTRADYRITSMKLPNNLGINVDVPAQEVTLRTQVVNGWRIYDPQSKQILDEFLYNKNMVFRGRGINPIKAVEAITNRNEAVKEYSRNVGIAYAGRLVPRSIRISRNYYVRGSDNFKIAQRRAQAGDWKGAADLWKQELDNSKPRVAGRAYYNMAISMEINGDIDQAIQYASTSFTEFNNNMALNYIAILRNRLHQNRVLEEQLAR